MSIKCADSTVGTLFLLIQGMRPLGCRRLGLYSVVGRLVVGITRRLVGWIDVVLGVLTVDTATIPLVAVYGGDSVGCVHFDIATLLAPMLYLWAMALDLDTYR